MPAFDPLASGALTNLFRPSPKDPQRIIKREDSLVEFKETYSHGSMAMYFKTIASFANNCGGYIIFGVGDRPRVLKGISGKSLTQFEELKVEEFTRNLCDYFAPAIKWTHCTFEYGSLCFGVIYIYPLNEKPAICKKSHDIKDDKYSLKEGDIYYRYGGRSEKIRYPELRAIIENQRQAEERQWLNFLRDAAKIGVGNAALLDVNSGRLTGSGGSIIIDDKLLEKISFIKEGEFNEVSGKPTLKLIGEIEKISASRIVVKESEKKVVKAITQDDLVIAFLRSEIVDDPIDYIKQICFSTSGNLPVFCYIRQAGIDVDTAVKIVDSTTARGQSKRKILERLNGKQIETKRFSSQTSAADKSEYVKLWESESIPEIISNISYCMQSILYMNKDSLIRHSEYVKKRLLYIYENRYESANQGLANDIRLAICKLDESIHL